MSEGEPVADMGGAPVPPDDEPGSRTRVIDWRAVLALVALLYVLVLAWVNYGSSVSVSIPPCIGGEISVVWLVLISLLVGAAGALVVQAGYRGYRRQRQALEEAARADFAAETKPGRGTETK